MSDQSHKLAKWGIITTILVALIGAGTSLYMHFDDKALKIEELSEKSIKDDEKKGASVSIKKVQLTPVDFDIPSSFFIEIENSHLKMAKDITLVVDFGESKIEKCAFRPNDKSNYEQNGDSYVLKIKLKELMKNESFYVNCHMSSPLFKKIILSASNVSIDKQLTWTSFKEQEKNPSSTSGLMILFSILGGILVVYLFIVLLRVLNRLLGMEW